MQQERQHAVLCRDHVKRHVPSIQLALPCLLGPYQFHAIDFLRDGDFIDHSLRTPSLRAVRFHADSLLRCSEADAVLLRWPFLDRAVAANSAAETAAISARPLGP